jgi:hypothetical protein
MSLPPKFSPDLSIVPSLSLNLSILLSSLSFSFLPSFLHFSLRISLVSLLLNPVLGKVFFNVLHILHFHSCLTSCFCSSCSVYAVLTKYIFLFCICFSSRFVRFHNILF